MSEAIDRLVEDYLDGTLAADGAAELAALARSDAAGLRRRIAFAGLLAQALDPADGAAVARSVLARIEAEDAPSRLVRAVRRRIAPPPRRRLGWPLAAAALLAAALAAWLLLPLAAPAEACRLAEGAAQVRRDGRLLALSAGAGLRRGDRLDCPAAVRLRWDDGSEVVLATGATAVVGAHTRLDLDRGVLDAVIAPQTAGAAFAMATAEARIEVLGTRFRLEAAAGRTRCALHSGAVRLVRLADGASLDLAPGQAAEVAPGAALAVDTAPAPDAWTPLFPATGLAGWRQQHGAWQQRDGIVRGASAAGGKIRLLSERPFTDLELSCRLRIAGAEFAEVQVGDYNWFFEVPARAGAWVELRLRQRGAVLECSADGVALTAQPGDGRPPRPGPLAFYVLPGGSLEIADARIR